MTGKLIISKDKMNDKRRKAEPCFWLGKLKVRSFE